MGLNIPRDLNQWQRWQQKQHPLRRLKGLIRPVPHTRFVVAVRGDAPAILIAFDADTPTQRMSLLEPLKALGDGPAAVLAPADLPRFAELLPGGPWQMAPVRDTDIPEQLRQLSLVLAVGHYLPAGALAHAWSRQLGGRFCVVQHGLLTPHAPPLPEDSHLLAFSDADADFWRSGRDDVAVEVVGSQLMWQAQQQPAVQAGVQDRPLFLGQLHGAELPRTGLARAAWEFCTATGAVYRPHPSETDRLSRLQHDIWRRQGITVDTSRSPLTGRPSPVVSVFSTGVLEAAARGVPAWVTYPSPPAWLQEFWERYQMSRWGNEPTPRPVATEREPASSIARIIDAKLGGRA